MANITILLRHSGSWVSEIEYENYRIDGILLRDNANYNNLVDGTSAQLGIDCTRKIMEIRYKMEGNLTPMEIRNEMGMRFFMELKRCQTNCGMYPLCITTKDHNFGCGINGEIAFEPDTSIVQVGGDDMNVSGVVLQEIRSVDALCILDMNSDHVIGDCNKKFVQVKQLYKDKKTIVAVMQKYVIDNRFQYKVARSDKKRLVMFVVLVAVSFLCIWYYV
ncbi:hypothetical protein KY284_037141 [Solanum tuberosum]|nr:hypothetical protein KY284_037141 [Solanum tuberosum]